MTDQRTYLGWLSLLLGLLGAAGAASAQPVSYNAAPVGAGVRWDARAGLSDAFFYGAEVGLQFGTRLKADALFLRGNNVYTDFEGFSGEPMLVNQGLRDLPARDVDVRRYGGRIQFNLGRRLAASYIDLESGIIRFDPSNLPASQHVYFAPGAGLTLHTERYGLSLGGQLLTYRYNPAEFLSPLDAEIAGQPRADFDTRTVYNPSLRAELAFRLSGPAPSRSTSPQVRPYGASQRSWRFFLKPFYGQINFNDNLRFANRQPLTGISAGTELSSYVTLGGFYWRGTQDERVFDTDLPDAFADIQFYGGETELRLNTGSLTPYLTLGGGYVDVLEGYRGRTAADVPGDRFFGIGGGGLEVPLIPALRLHADLRALLMSSDASNAVLQSESSLHLSPMYTAGLELSLGGRPRPDPLGVDTQRMQDEIDAIYRTTARRRALAALEEELSADVLAALSEEELQELVRLRMREQSLLRPAVADTMRSNISDRSITIPVPEEGAIYLQFGENGMARTETVPTQPDAAQVTAEEIRQIVRETLDAQLQQLEGDDPAVQQLAARLDRIEQRLTERLDREIERLRAEQLREGQNVTLIERPDGEIVAAVAPQETAPHSLLGRNLEAVFPYAGLRVGEGPEQVLLGARGDYRSPGGGGARLLPEAALGFGGGASINLAGNVAFPVAHQRLFPYRPYAGLGIGLFSERGLAGLELGWNLLLGAEYPLPQGIVFGEFSTLNLFDFNRLLFGYRMAL